jgi:hypothetical protein
MVSGAFKKLTKFYENSATRLEGNQGHVGIFSLQIFKNSL